MRHASPTAKRLGAFGIAIAADVCAADLVVLTAPAPVGGLGGVLVIEVPGGGGRG